jgi:hypothetical protein
MLRGASAGLMMTNLDNVDTAGLADGVLRTGREIERPPDA